MITATRRWFRRNRTNFVIGAGVIGGAYLAGQYVLGRLREARQRVVEDRASKENLRRRFEQNQGDCTYTVLALLPTIRDVIIGALPVEQITEQLQQERQERLKRLAASEAASSEYPSAPPSIVDDASTTSFVHASQLVEDRPKRSKAQLWQDMKINSIARALSLLYIEALLILLTRIQLNLLGRRTYLSSVVSMAAPPQPSHLSTISLEDHDGSFETVYGNDFETNRMYLTFSWWLLHRGAKSILDRVMMAVKEVFGKVNIREDMSLERLSELVIEVRRKVEGATESERRSRSWLEYLLPPKEQELFVMHQAGMSDGSESASPEPGHDPMEVDSVTPSLRRLLDETADLIDSPTFALVLSHLLDAGFSHLVDVRIASEAFKAPLVGPGDRITEITDTKCKLAHILPVFCRQAHAIVVGSGDLDAMAGAGDAAVPNEYLAVMDRVHDLEAFAAVIYSSNFEYEVVDSPRPETASLQASVVSLKDSSFALDESQPSLISQTRSFVDQTTEKTRAALGSTIEQTRAVVETQVEQARDAITPKVEQARDFIAPKLEQARDVVVPRLEQARDAVVPRIEQAREIVSAQAQQARDVLEAQAEQSREVVNKLQVEQARDVLQTGEQKIPAATRQSIDDTRAATAQRASEARETVTNAVKQAEQSIEQTIQPAIQAVRQQFTSVPETPFEREIESNVLDETGPDLTKSIIPVDEDADDIATAPPSSLTESAVVVPSTPNTLSQSTVVVDTPDISQSTVEVAKPSSSLTESAISVAPQSTQAAPPPSDFETAWAQAQGGKKVTNNKKPA